MTHMHKLEWGSVSEWYILRVFAGRLSGVVIIGVFYLLLSNSAFGADTTYQCIPSGFSLGIPPFHGPFEVNYGSGGLDFSGSISFGAMRERLGEQLHKSSLFSGVTFYEDGPNPDSTDLTLLVSIPTMRQLSEGPPASYHLIVDIMLLENVGGNALFNISYETSYESPYSSTTPAAERFNADMQVAFASLIPGIAIDLNRTLNESADPLFLGLAEAKTVTHSHLEPLRILPTIVAGNAPGLGHYSLFVQEHLRDRLARKDCFTLMPLPDAVTQCVSDSGAADLKQLIGILGRCKVGGTASQGMLLVTFLSSDGQYNRVRCVLLLLPQFQTLYDQSLIAAAGWHLGNALEKLAAGIAQASHSVPH